MCQVALVQLCGWISDFGQQLATIHAILGILVGDDDSPPSRADQAPESEPVASDEPAFARTDQASATEPVASDERRICVEVSGPRTIRLELASLGAAHQDAGAEHLEDEPQDCQTRHGVRFESDTELGRCGYGKC